MELRAQLSVGLVMASSASSPSIAAAAAASPSSLVAASASSPPASQRRPLLSPGPLSSAARTRSGRLSSSGRRSLSPLTVSGRLDGHRRQRSPEQRSVRAGLRVVEFTGGRAANALTVSAGARLVHACAARRLSAAAGRCQRLSSAGAVCLRPDAYLLLPHCLAAVATVTAAASSLLTYISCDAYCITHPGGAGTGVARRAAAAGGAAGTAGRPVRRGRRAAPRPRP
jgi:hypothetical protein